MDSPAPGQRARFGSAPGLADRIERHIRLHNVQPGEHLSAQQLAGLFAASRTPVNQALRLLQSRGLLRHEPNRGFFVEQLDPRGGRPDPADPIEAAYAALARDRLAGQLGEEVTETELLLRYSLTRSQLQILLSRVMQEGWIERRSGYGWAFTEMLTTAEALTQSFRLRRVLEPASLLEPGYRLDPEAAARCRRTELAMLAGELATMPLDALFDRGVYFHETLVGGSGNRFFLDTVRRVNRIRRLLSYQAMTERDRYVRRCEEHLHLIDLLERGRVEDAAACLLRHLESAEIHYATALGANVSGGGGLAEGRKPPE